MLMYGPAYATGYIDKDCVFFNLSSLSEQFQRLNLMPPNNLGALDSYDFDQKYASYVLENDNVFCELMKIMLPLYQNTSDVFLVTDQRDMWEMEIVDSLLKLIQQRYGINAVLINTKEDYQNAVDDNFNPYDGIRIMDDDALRYESLYFQWYNANGGRLTADAKDYL